ncbi:substrate-binding domain-containing protein [Cryptosporangium sp. NPDC048952]|uniref:substrate-binding domain-containing protein n=1 Tax=Cryptosporangium sp. NPDC048952 TaxID=3363961 RepID=UPI0037220988
MAAACVSLVLVVAGCGDAESSTQAGDTATKTMLGLVVPDSTSESWDALLDAAADEGRDTDVDISPDAAENAEAAAQVSKVEAFMPEKMDCFAVAPVDPKALVAPLTGFAKNGVKIFNVGQRLDEKATQAAGLTVTSFIGPSDLEIGHQAVREMISAVPAGSTVAMVVGSPGDANAAQQREGFEDGSDGKLDVITTDATNDDFTNTKRIVTEAIGAQPNVRGIFTSSDMAGRAAAAAIAELGVAGTVKVVSVGGTREGLRAVKAGELDATVATYPASVGAVLVRACLQATSGKAVKPRLTTQSWLVNKSNVDAELASYPNSTQPFPDPLV